MKKVNFKKCLLAFLTTFCLMLIGVVGVNAQQGPDATTGSNTGILSVPQGTFASNDDALLIVAQKLSTIKDQIEQLVPGSPIYTAVETQYIYYQTIETALMGGAEVPNAIVQGLRELSSSDVYNVSAATLASLKQEAIDLFD